MNVENILHHSKKEDEKILRNFSETLTKLGFEHNLLSNNELSKD
jgi:hypothetical protein